MGFIERDIVASSNKMVEENNGEEQQLAMGMHAYLST